MNDAVTEGAAEVTQDVTEEPTKETPSMEELLQEFDAGANEEVEEPTQDVGDSRIDEVHHFMQQEQARKTNEDINNAISMMKGAEESISGLPDTMLRGYLNELARGNPKLLNAFANRHDKPETWGKIVESAARDLGSQLSIKRDDKITSDMASVRSAVEQSESKSNDGPTDEEIKNMSPAEFQQYKAKLGINSDVWG